MQSRHCSVVFLEIAIRSLYRRKSSMLWSSFYQNGCFCGFLGIEAGILTLARIYPWTVFCVALTSCNRVAVARWLTVLWLLPSWRTCRLGLMNEMAHGKEGGSNAMTWCSRSCIPSIYARCNGTSSSLSGILLQLTRITRMSRSCRISCIS